MSSKLREARDLLEFAGDSTKKVRLRVDHLCRASELQQGLLEDVVEAMQRVLEVMESSE